MCVRLDRGRVSGRSALTGLESWGEKKKKKKHFWDAEEMVIESERYRVIIPFAL